MSRPTDTSDREIVLSRLLAATVKFGAVEGGNQTLDRLTEHLGKMA